MNSLSLTYRMWSKENKIAPRVMRSFGLWVQTSFLQISQRGKKCRLWKEISLCLCSGSKVLFNFCTYFPSILRLKKCTRQPLRVVRSHCNHPWLRPRPRFGCTARRQMCSWKILFHLMTEQRLTPLVGMQRTCNAKPSKGWRKACLIYIHVRFDTTTTSS